jgi:hypothetical protein
MKGFSSAMALMVVVLCASSTVQIGAAAPAAATSVGKVKADDWGTIRGQVVFGGSVLPQPKQLDVNKDQDHCLEKGPLFTEELVVNPETKGVRYAVAFLKAPKGETLPIHPSLKEPSPKEAILDQPRCAFVPHLLAMRSDQTLVAKNPAPVPHNVVITGFTNTYNRQIPSKKSETFTLEPEDRAIALSCGAHPWMKGFLWVFDHPYFAVTDADGKFEIKNAPAGERSLVLWHEKVGWLDPKSGKNGKKIVVKAGEVTDLGKFELKPE